MTVKKDMLKEICVFEVVKYLKELTAVMQQMLNLKMKIYKIYI
jgi:hypothetical protein